MKLCAIGDDWGTVFAFYQVTFSCSPLFLFSGPSDQTHGVNKKKKKTPVMKHCCGVVEESLSSTVQFIVLIQPHQRILNSQLNGRSSRIAYGVS